MRREVVVVETRHGEVARNRESLGSGEREARDRHGVVRVQDRRGPIRQGEQLRGAVASRARASAMRSDAAARATAASRWKPLNSGTEAVILRLQLRSLGGN